MRMRLVYLTCALLWLVMSTLIGMSFASRAVFDAEQRFSAFDQHLFEQLGQKLQANDVVLASFAAYSAEVRTAADERAFTRRLLTDHPQILGLVRLDTPSDLRRQSDVLRKTCGMPADWLSNWSALRFSPRAAGSGPFLVSRPLRLENGSPAYFVARAVDGSGSRFAGMLVRADALLSGLGPLPPGGELQMWHQADRADSLWRVQSPDAGRTMLEHLLFPHLEVSRRVGDQAQPLMVRVVWQPGISELNPYECMAAATLSLMLLVIMLVGVSSYGKFLAGSHEREMRLFYLANHDRLTSLANRNLFYDRLHHAISRLNRNGCSLAVLFLDMDRFKPVNDTYGHAAGDRVLQMIAARLKMELRSEDTVARLGGDEFVVLLEDIESKQEVNLVVERLKHSIECAYEVGGNNILLGVSIGVAYYPEDGVLIEELLSVADRKMYGEKSELALAVGCG